MKKTFICLIILLLTLNIWGCTERIKEKARYIKHSELVNNFDLYKGELIKVEGVVCEFSDNIVVLGVKDGEYSVYVVPNTVKYKPYKGEYITVYGTVDAVSKEPVFFEIKAIRIKPKIIEQTKNPAEELKNDVLIQEVMLSE